MKQEAYVAARMAAGSLDFKRLLAVINAFEDDFDINACGGVHHLSPLHICSMKANGVEGIRILLDKQANLEVRDAKERTPCHCAARQGRDKNLRLLLEHGADPNAIDRRGLTPLMDSARNGHLDCVDILLRNGADCRAVSDTYKWSSLHYSACNGWDTVVQRLLHQDQDLVNMQSSDGMTALHIATRNGHSTSVRLLVQAGSDVFMMDEEGYNPFHHCCIEGRLASAKVLLAEPRLLTERTDDGDLPIRLGLNHRKRGIVEWCIECGNSWNEVEDYLLNGHVDIGDVCVYLMECNAVSMNDYYSSIKRLTESILSNKPNSNTYSTLLTPLHPIQTTELFRTLMNHNNFGLGSLEVLGGLIRCGLSRDRVVEYTAMYGTEITDLLSIHPTLILNKFDYFLENCVLSTLVTTGASRLPFSERIKWLRARLATTNTDNMLGDSMIINREGGVLTNSCSAIVGMSGDELSRLKVSFAGEAGVGLGVKREWLSMLIKELFDPDCALFTPSDDNAYQPNPNSSVNPDHLSYFAFCGRIIGMCIVEGLPIDVHFTRPFYRQILHNDYKSTLNDLRYIDATFHKSLQYILQYDNIEQMDLDFTVDGDWFGDHRSIELREDGSSISVTSENRAEYVELIVQSRVVESVKDQTTAFKNGLSVLVPSTFLSVFTDLELEILIAGDPYIDVDDWKANTEYSNGYSESSDQVEAFWSVIQELSSEERGKVLQFATGSMRVPAGGFAALVGADGPTLFTIMSVDGGSLPRASTCFNLLKIPEQCNSVEIMSAALRIVIDDHLMGFGEA